MLAEAIEPSSSDKMQISRAMAIVNNWRASHSFPLNTIQMNLRSRTRTVDANGLVSQRLKRATSIEAKLRRLSHMRLTQMQDVGGCRAVVKNNASVSDLRQLMAQSKARHVLVGNVDYVATPDVSGYRSVHLIYRYQSDRNTTYNKHLIEVQIRSALQHAWATTVEIVGTFLQQSLKSSEGNERWLKFFANVSSAFAMREGCVPVPNTFSGAQLQSYIRHEAALLRVHETLRSYRQALSFVGSNQLDADSYVLLILRLGQRQLRITEYRASDLAAATTAYLETEKQLDLPAGDQAVLVRAGSIDALRRAYPNYFLDSDVFVQELDAI